jgi:DNA-binding LacI/PurR family transcriptional regulator
MARRTKRATIRELAAHTGLSPAAVSYALRGVQVSAETVDRVRAAADELGYEADPIARALRGAPTGMVGVLVGSLADFWNQELVRAIQRELRGTDRHTLVADADGHPDWELEMARRLIDHRVDGLIVLPIGPPGDGWEGIARDVPTVTLGDPLAGVPTAGAVEFDNERGVSDTLEHLAGLGHRDIAVLSWAVATAPGRRTERAVRTAAAELDLRCDLVPCAYSLNGSAPLALDLLSSAGRPTAIFCLSDSIAYGVYAACSELGLEIPGDVAVAGFDDHPISRLLQPPLTSTAWGAERVARAATELLTDALVSGVGGRRRTISPQLHVRGSTLPDA